MRLILLMLLAAQAPEPEWTRHVIAEGYVASTAVAAKFTGHGLPDVISNDGKRTLLYVSPGWTMKPLNEGHGVMHSAVMDADGDGDLDYIGATYRPGLIFWLECPPHPLTDPWPFHVIDAAADGGIDGIQGLAVGDIDGDGKPELAATSGLSKGKFANSIAWYRIPEGKKKYGPWERWIAGRWDAPGSAQSIALGDVNGDGMMDIASAAKFPPDGNWFAWWEQPDAWDQPFKKHIIATGQEGATHILIVDVNGDGRMDFVASRGHGHGVCWFEAPNWAPHEVDAGISGPNALAAGDLNRDGHVDIVAIGKNDFTVVWYENDGKGNFRRHIIAQRQAGREVRIVDLDGDGAPDILIAGDESKNVLWYENPHKKM